MSQIKDLFDKEMEAAAAAVAKEEEPTKKDGDGDKHGCQPGASSNNDGMVIESDEEVAPTPERKLAAKLFPKTPFAELSPWVTQAGRKVSRTCDLIVEPQDCCPHHLLPHHHHPTTQSCKSYPVPACKLW